MSSIKNALVILLEEIMARGGSRNKGRKFSEEWKRNMSLSRKGRKFSEDHRLNISKALKGKKGTWIGKKHSEETKVKMSIAQKGKKRSPEACLRIGASKKGVKLSEDAKKKISLALKGRKFSEDHKHKISASLKGCVFTDSRKRNLSLAMKKRFSVSGAHPWLGRKHSLETIEKLRELGKHVVFSPETRAKISIACKGRKLSEEHKRKISMANKGKHRSAEQRIQMRFIKLGQIPNEETRKKMSLARKGKKFSLEHRMNMSGERNANWAGGISKISDRIRGTIEYKAWRLSVFKRDRFICQLCDSHSHDLHADHIKPFSLILRENDITSVEEGLSCSELWDLKNGRTLCAFCHKQTLTYGKDFNNLERIFYAN